MSRKELLGVGVLAVLDVLPMMNVSFPDLRFEPGPSIFPNLIWKVLAAREQSLMSQRFFSLVKNSIGIFLSLINELNQP